MYIVIIAPRVGGVSKIAISSMPKGTVTLAIKGASISSSRVVALAAAVKLITIVAA